MFSLLALFFPLKKSECEQVTYTSRVESKANSEESDDNSEAIINVKDFPPKKLIQSPHSSTLDLTVKKLSERIAGKNNKCLLILV